MAPHTPGPAAVICPAKCFLPAKPPTGKRENGVTLVAFTANHHTHTKAWNGEGFGRWCPENCCSVYVWLPFDRNRFPLAPAAFPAIPDNGVIIKPSVVTCTIGTHLLGSVAPIGRRPIDKMWLTQFRPLLVSGLKNAVPLARNGVSTLIDRRHMLRIARTLWAVFLRNMLP